MSTNLPGNESAANRRRGATFPFADRFFDDFMRDWPLQHSASRSFPIDVAEAGTHYLITCDLPGVSNDQLDITVEDNTLSISVQEKKAEHGKNLNYLHRERWQGFTSRSVTLPHEANAERIDAQLKDGVLNVKVEKHPEKQPRKIQVSAS